VIYLERIIFHIDCNSAFLSWTSIDRLAHGETLDLRTIPSIIGGDQQNRHGVVLAKSVSAKKLGIRTGEPIVNALKKCPTLIIAPPDHSLYQKYSDQLMSLLSTFTNDLEKFSIDEAYLDFTPIAPNYPSPVAAANQIKDSVHEKLGFTVNIGIAPNKLLAKMASDFEKPNKVHTLFQEEIPLKMWPLPVNELYMTGKASVEKLYGLGIRTIGDLAAMDPALLVSHFKSHGKTMWEYANGIDNTPVISAKQIAKGIGSSTTLSKNVENEEEANNVLLNLADTVAARLRQEKQLAATVIVEIKYSNFSSFSHQSKLLTPSYTTEVIYHQACALFKELWNGEPIRLLGIRTSNLIPDDAPVQLNLFDFAFGQTIKDTKNSVSDPPGEKQKRLDAAMDSIRKKYGKQAVVRGRFLKPSAPENKQ